MSRIIQGREARMERADRVSAQTDKPLEHEARMKELLLRQAELNAARAYERQSVTINFHYVSPEERMLGQ